MDLDAEWESFLSNGALNQDNNVIMSINNDDVENNEHEEPEHPYASYIPKCSDNRISTKTMITYLNQAIDLDSVFWSLPVIDYHEQREGIIKKQMKVTTHSQEDTEILLTAFHANVTEAHVLFNLLITIVVILQQNISIHRK